jgi:hypothetical protein
MVGVGDLVQRTGDGRTGRVLGGRAIERSGDAMCGLYRAQGDEKHGWCYVRFVPCTRRREALVEYSVAGRSRSQVAPCAVCTVHVETRSVSFLVQPQNQG